MVTIIAVTSYYSIVVFYGYAAHNIIMAEMLILRATQTKFDVLSLLTYRIYGYGS